MPIMLQYLIAAAGLYIGWSLICLELNYKRASTMNVPLVRVPIDPMNVLWQVFGTHVFKLLDLVPSFILPHFVRYMRRGWFFLDKADSHLRYGPVWAVVSPGGIHMQICDSEAIHDMFDRRYDFIRPSENYKLLEVYGPCISTADADNWPRHRKVLAAPFNESVMRYVWSESLSQAEQMIGAWLETETVIKSFAKDTRTLSLNVIAATGFRKSFSFQSANDGVEKLDATPSYRDALSTVLDNAIILMLVPYRYLSLPFLPKSFQKVGAAGAEFKQHMERMLKEETAAIERGEAGAGSLMTSFARALNTSDVKKEGGRLPKGLSVDEIYGNIFVINFAGHDTTANSLAFSMALLASQPEVQDWVAEEVRKTTSVGVGDWDYSTVYPSLLRCRAVLYETLRLFPPIPNLPKHTSPSPQRLTIDNRTIIIPPNTNINPNCIAVQTHPRYWPDSLTWKPSRWLTTDTNGQESLVTPARKTYFPWSDGPQNCPGRKFSEVEFVAVLALMMRNLVLTVVKEEGESEDMTRERAVRVANDCDLQLILRMRDADQLTLRCEKRT